MPYIQEAKREKFDEIIESLKKLTFENAGELNYLITKICHQYFEKEICYQAFNDIVGALEGAKLELYRRKIAEYEDIKIKQNGDV